MDMRGLAIISLAALAACSGPETGGGPYNSAGSDASANLSAMLPAELRARALAALRAVQSTIEAGHILTVTVGRFDAICGYVTVDQNGGARPYVVRADGTAVIAATPEPNLMATGDTFADLYILSCATDQELQAAAAGNVQAANMVEPANIANLANLTMPVPSLSDPNAYWRGRPGEQPPPGADVPWQTPQPEGPSHPPTERWVIRGGSAPAPGQVSGNQAEAPR